ncbi:hypothetical protein Cantr_07574 [Candida viswanathii]|uniref:Uncharacterized protein n=1 Tax=Candida viswanathii TaxID=5486 RepID=A0A367XZ09_9ASCO|nr:hypothetical protein Cantr_07574 [Candida viswanathii]
MSGILDLLNADDLINRQQQAQQQQQQQSQEEPMVGLTTPTQSLSSNSSPRLPFSPQSVLSSPQPPAPAPKPNSNKPLVILRDQIPKSKVNRHIMNNKKFVKLAIRRKYSTKKTKTDTKQSKLHIKSLKAGIKVKMTLSNNLFSLYHNLIPFTDNRKFFTLFADDDSSTSEFQRLNTLSNDKNLVCKSLQLINNNVVDLSEYSNKILKSFTNGNSTPTFNSLDTALNSLFGTKEFTLIRITRSTTDDVHGSTILKLETATPGDFNLIDDEENSDEMLHSLGKTNEVPNNLFFKKIIARPRYKSNMKIYFVPECSNYSLYTDSRMLERDLYNGIIQLEFADNDNLNDLRIKKASGYNRNVYCTFPCDDVLRQYKKSLIETKSLPVEEPEELKQEQPHPKSTSPPGPVRAQSMDDSLMMMPSQPPQQPIGFPSLQRRPSLIMPNPPVPSFIQQHQLMNVIAGGGYPNFQQHPPHQQYPPQQLQLQLQQYQREQQPQQPQSNNTSPSFIHLPPPPPVVLPQTPRSSTVREDVLGLLRPFNDTPSSSSLPYQDMVNKRRMSIHD